MSPRLLHPAEVIGRLRHAGTIVIERIGLAPIGRPPMDGARKPRLPLGMAPSDDIRTVYEARPEERLELLEHAQRALEGRLSLLGYRDLRIPLPVDWHADPLRGLRAPRGHWSTIPYLDGNV